MKHNKKVTPIVMRITGLHCEKTLNPWTTFILLETPEIINPEANVKLNKKAVNISLKILFMSWNYERLMMNPIISRFNLNQSVRHLLAIGFGRLNCIA